MKTNEKTIKECQKEIEEIRNHSPKGIILKTKDFDESPEDLDYWKDRYDKLTKEFQEKIKKLKKEMDICRDKTDIWDNEKWDSFAKMFKKKIKEIFGE